MKKDESILTMYLKDINRIPLLSRQEEEELALKAKNGDKSAKDKIVRGNLRFVVTVAKKYQNSGLELEDLISEGQIGLINAIEKFDVERGIHFISYAVWWIRQAILKAISEKGHAIRLPLNRANELVKIEHARKALSSKRGKINEFKEIALMLDMTEEHVKEMINISKELLSLDAPLANDNKTNVGDIVEDSTTLSPVDATIKNAMKEDINKVLDTLKPNEAKVIRLRYGLNGGKPMSLKEVGDNFHLTKERIRQIEKRAILNLRHPRRVRTLEAYVA